MSTFTYNGITLTPVRTNRVSRSNVMTDDRADRLYQKVTVDLTCVYNPALTSYDPATGGAVAGKMPAQTDAAIRHALMEPGKAMSFTNGGYPVEVTTGHDRYIGPQPQACVVTQISGSKTWLVQYSIEYWTSPCTFATGDMPLLSNRWTQSIRIGMDKLETVVTHGVATFDLGAIQAMRASEANPFLSADFWRAWILPLVPSKFFQRQSIAVQINSLGDVLQYEIVDQEMVVALGDTKDPLRLGVQNFSGVQTYTSSQTGDGGVPTGQMLSILEASVVGTRNSLASNLIVWLLKLAIERLAIPAGPIDPARHGMLKQLSIRQHLDKRQVDLHAQVLYPPSLQGPQGAGGVNLGLLQADLTTLLNRGGANPQFANGNAFGTAGVQAVSQAIKASACEVPDVPRALTPAGSKSELLATKTEPTVTVTTDQSLPVENTRYSPDTAKLGVYTDYKIDSKYVVNQGTLAAAVAGPPGTLPPIMPQGIIVNLPMMMLVVDWTAERYGNRPVLPDPNNSNPLFMLTGKPEITVAAPEVGVDGQTLVYRASGRWTYLVMDPAIGLAPGQVLPTSVVPWSNVGYLDEDAAYTSYDVVHGIIDPPAYTSGSGWIPPIPGAGGPAGADG